MTEDGGVAGEARTGEAATGEAATGEAATGEARTGEARTGEARTGEAATGGASDLAAVLQALADPARLRVVEVLSRSPRRAGDLADAVGVPAPTMSKHLRVLLAAGIVADERGARDARVRVFRLRRESVVAVRAWLDQVQAHWDEQLKAFKAHVEREAGK
jgi:DNA-binding transcriptional ArsR family regulator